MLNKTKKGNCHHRVYNMKNFIVYNNFASLASIKITMKIKAFQVITKKKKNVDAIFSYKTLLAFLSKSSSSSF